MFGPPHSPGCWRSTSDATLHCMDELALRRAEKYVRDRPEFLYTSVPDGYRARYVFTDRVCLGIAEALAYAMDLAGELPDAEDS